MKEYAARSVWYDLDLYNVGNIFLIFLLAISSFTLYHKVSTFTTLRKKPFENIVRKGENAGYQFLAMYSYLS